mmetsp:Transcript_1544/g.4552  ORF Transcript_1544/g.4552 Transcript_1544/m.4552 type:complete len:209 (-) Transcript_1544:1426-2052(-)
MWQVSGRSPFAMCSTSCRTSPLPPPLVPLPVKRHAPMKLSRPSLTQSTPFGRNSTQERSYILSEEGQDQRCRSEAKNQGPNSARSACASWAGNGRGHRSCREASCRSASQQSRQRHFKSIGSSTPPLPSCTPHSLQRRRSTLAKISAKRPPADSDVSPRLISKARISEATKARLPSTVPCCCKRSMASIHAAPRGAGNWQTAAVAQFC